MNKKPRVVPLLDSHDDAKVDTSGDLLDIAGAATRLHCSERFIRRLVQERRIPFVKLGGTRVRFLPKDLDKWIAAQRVNAVR